jgi:diguanylate cyclase (GGDEF)-like protein
MGGLIALAFRRGRVLFALISLALAYYGYRSSLQHGLTDFTAYTVFAALCVFVPFNLGALSLLRERGMFNLHGVQRLAVILLQTGFAAWVVRAGKLPVTQFAYDPLVDPALIAALPVPHFGVAVMAVGFLTACVAWFFSRSATDLALAGAVAAYAFAAYGVASPHDFAVFITAGGLILTIAVLQDTFRMAFRDELTGLPSRRALNERLDGLSRHYTIAMLDIDRFKGLNDHYGHDVGDQVMKMVAARLARVGGGGSAYRYGGEEFTLIFPGKSIEETIPHLEALREDIAGRKLALRRSERAARSKSRKQRRGAAHPDPSVSVTISIGVAGRDGRSDRPYEVVQAADQALYRAKNKGRNQVSR